MKRYYVGLIIFLIIVKPQLFGQVPETISKEDSIIVETYKESFKEISSLKPIVDRYKKRRQKKVNQTLVLFAGHKDAYSIFFDATKLARITADAIKVTEARKTYYCGLRFYYAVYERNYEHKGPLPPCLPSTGEKIIQNYGLMHTLVIVPVEYDPVKKVFRDITIGKRIMAMMTEPENNGTLCPPPNPVCNGQTF